MTCRRLPQTILVIVRRRRSIESAPGDHPVAISRRAMAYRTVNVVALFAAIQIGFRNLHRNRVDILGIKPGLTVDGRLRGWRLRRLRSRLRRWFLAKIERAIFSQVTTRHSPFDQRPRSRAILKERVLAISDRLRLILHVSSTASEQ